MTEPTRIDVAIIGAGIIGVSTAFKLQEAGRTALLIDRRGIAEETSRGNAGAFAKTAFWPVTISYFNENSKTDALPVYRMSFKLYENGITRDLTMDYGDFVLTGKLAKLEMLDKKPETCK